MLAWDYETAKRRFGWFVRHFCILEVEGLENLHESVVCVTNHISFLDPVVLSVVSPIQVSFGAKSELFESWLFKNLVISTEQLCLKRDGMTKSEWREFVELAKLRLNRGLIVGLFPEGTRSHGKMLDFKSGAVAIAKATEREITPGGICYSHRGLKLVVRIRFGESIEASGMRTRELTRLLEERVAELSGKERAYRRRGLKKRRLPVAA